MPQMTLLSIDGIDFSPYAVRGITMTLEPIQQAASLARDCRGELVDISVAQFRQHKVTISCTDQEAPELTDVWPGMDITVTCIPGMGAANTTGDVLTILAKVTAWDTSRDEWGADLSWNLEAEQRAAAEVITTGPAPSLGPPMPTAAAKVDDTVSAINILFDKPLDESSVPLPDAFVAIYSFVGRSPESVMVTGSTVKLTFDAVYSATGGSMSYTAGTPPLKGVNGAAVADLSGYPVAD